jgi:hypothetical protein
MRKHFISQHVINILFLSICACFVVLSFLHPHNNMYQLKLAALALILYFSLSYLHHFMDKSLTLRTYFEYILVGSLAFLIILGVLS